MARTLSGVAAAVHGRLVGDDAPFGMVSTDSRSIEAGALFVAIHGDHFDGNDFVAAASASGAAGALVSRLADVALPQITVADTRLAFGNMAQAWRHNFSVPVIAVTGSSGKTTVKELIASILGCGRQVCVTPGNLNNDIGVPLTLMRANDRDGALVIELGANHAGEIDYLSDLVEPTIGVITNAGEAHLEGFGSLEGVADAKGELLEHLPPDGTAILNADDQFWPQWRSRSRARNVVSFGLSASADCRVLGEPRFGSAGSRFDMRLPNGDVVAVELPLLGIHNVANALAAAAAAAAAGASNADIRSGLEAVRPVRGRLRTIAGRGGTTLIDDSYNANPSSVRAAVDYLSHMSGRRVLVLGDMAELGPGAESLHREIGEYATGKIDVMIAVGDLAAIAARAFGGTSYALASNREAAAVLEDWLDPSLTVLVKGSRVMRLEEVVTHLSDSVEQGGSRC